MLFHLLFLGGDGHDRERENIGGMIHQRFIRESLIYKKYDS